MSKFALTQRDDGSFSLAGEVSFQTAEAILRDSNKLFAKRDAIHVELSEVTATDSAGLALLLEWLGQARRNNVALTFAAIPEKIKAIAITAEIGNLLDAAYSVADSSSAAS